MNDTNVIQLYSTQCLLKLSPYLKYKYKNPRVEGENSDFSSQLIHFHHQFRQVS
jgi:hypothetical protein